MHSLEVSLDCVGFRYRIRGLPSLVLSPLGFFSHSSVMLIARGLFFDFLTRIRKGFLSKFLSPALYHSTVWMVFRERPQ